MQHRPGSFPRFAGAFTLLGLLFLLPVAGSMRQSQEKPKRKGFGWSLDQPNHNPKKKSAAEKRAENKTTAYADNEIRLESTLAVFDIMVRNKEGMTLSGFKKEDFDVTEDGKKQDIAMLTLGDGSAVSRSIILILDYSGSQFPYIKTSTDAAQVLVDNLGPKDKMAVVTDDVSLLVDFTDNKAEIKNALESLKVRSSGGTFGKSMQFSALMATLKELLRENEQSVIILQTDGDQLLALHHSDSRPILSVGFDIAGFALEDLYSAVEKSNVTIYSVIPGPQLIGLPENKLAEQFKLIMEQEKLAMREVNPGEYEAWKTIQRKSNDKLFKAYAKTRLNQHMALASIASLSGGWTEYLPTPDKAQEIYTRIFASMNQRYNVTYYPTNARHDGKQRNVKIEVRAHPEYAILGRKSYYAPAN